MKSTNTYLLFNGNCAEAMRFYEKLFGGKLRLLTVKDSPAAKQMPQHANRTLHARLDFPGGVLMGSDWLAPQPYPGSMQGFNVAIEFETTDEARRVYDALAKGGKVTMPMDKTFWVEAFGSVIDRFGTPFMISGGREAA